MYLPPQNIPSAIVSITGNEAILYSRGWGGGGGGREGDRRNGVCIGRYCSVTLHCLSVIVPDGAVLNNRSLDVISVDHPPGACPT